MKAMKAMKASPATKKAQSAMKAMNAMKAMKGAPMKKAMKAKNGGKAMKAMKAMKAAPMKMAMEAKAGDYEVVFTACHHCKQACEICNIHPGSSFFNFEEYYCPGCGGSLEIVSVLVKRDCKLLCKTAWRADLGEPLAGADVE